MCSGSPAPIMPELPHKTWWKNSSLRGCVPGVPGTENRFIEPVAQWKAASGIPIIRQQKRLGESATGIALRFTMDEGLSKAVSGSLLSVWMKTNPIISREADQSVPRG